VGSAGRQERKGGGIKRKGPVIQKGGMAQFLYFNTRVEGEKEHRGALGCNGKKKNAVESQGGESRAWGGLWQKKGGGGAVSGVQ